MAVPVIPGVASPLPRPPTSHGSGLAVGRRPRFGTWPRTGAGDRPRTWGRGRHRRPFRLPRRLRVAAGLIALIYTLLVGITLAAAAVADVRWDSRGAAVLLVLALWMPQTVLSALRYARKG